MNFSLLSESIANCSRYCDGVCVYESSYSYYYAECFTNSEYIFCHKLVSIIPAIILFGINLIVYIINCCSSEYRSRPCVTISSMFANLSSFLLIPSFACLSTASFDPIWIIFLSFSAGYTAEFILFRCTSKCAFRNCCPMCCNTIWDLEQEEDFDDDSIDDYLNSVYDNPPVFTLHFQFVTQGAIKPEEEMYHANVKYGSWELESEKTKIENRKHATVIIPKNEYKSVGDFDKKLQEKINTTKEVVAPYDFRNSLRPDPYIKCETFNVNSDGRIYTKLGFFKFMKSSCGKFINFIFAIFGIDVIVENICWILSDVHFVDNVKKISMKEKELETPAYAIRGKDKDKPVITVFDDKLPYSLSRTDRYKISDDQPVNQEARNPPPYNYGYNANPGPRNPNNNYGQYGYQRPMGPGYDNGYYANPGAGIPPNNYGQYGNQRPMAPNPNYGRPPYQEERIPNDDYRRPPYQEERKLSDNNRRSNNHDKGVPPDLYERHPNQEEREQSKTNATKSSLVESLIEDQSYEEKDKNEDEEKPQQIKSVSGENEEPENEEI